MFKAGPQKGFKKELGELGEKLASQYLEEKGYTILVRNFRCPLGEIDLIALCDDVLVFVEVRSTTAADETNIAPSSINLHKQKKLRQLAAFYLQKHDIQNSRLCRFDVVIISFYKDFTVKKIELIKDAF